ncbi:MAG: ATP phosphoribosyltransferase regulatory subunit, partial [Clostridia bacterium]|nr:ATP phosphoribosyltransferase regulatory subunit [Clostridia bacterium]
ILATTTTIGKLGFKNFRININDRRILKAMAAYSGFAEEDYDTVFIILDKMDKIGMDGVESELKESGFAPEAVDKYMSLFKGMEGADNRLKYLADTIADYMDADVEAGLSEIIDSVQATKAADFDLVFDPTLVRGMSYYTGNIFESSTNTSMADTMTTMYISYRDSYKNSDKFNETKSIEELVKEGKFDSDELYLEKYVTKSRVILSDEKDYKYDINWIMAIICGGFFLYSLFFAGIMLGRRQIEFLFLFCISPIVFATSVCNKQRRGAVIEQLVSLALQSAVVMLIVSLSVMVMQEVNATTFFTNTFMNLTTKTLLYLGCATFILTGSQVINRFIGANVSAASGREQLMSLMGYGKMAGIGATVATGATIGGGLLANGGAMKVGKRVGSEALSQVGLALGSYGAVDSASGQTPTKMQRFANALGTKMYMTGQKGMNGKTNANKFSASDAFINAGASSLGSTVRKVMPRASYNASYYRRRQNMF